jgi:hypothetical protein
VERVDVIARIGRWVAGHNGGFRTVFLIGQGTSPAKPAPPLARGPPRLPAPRRRLMVPGAQGTRCRGSAARAHGLALGRASRRGCRGGPRRGACGFHCAHVVSLRAAGFAASAAPATRLGALGKVLSVVC